MGTIPTITPNTSEESTWISETYDRYAGMLYGVLLDLCPSEWEAKDVLIRTFRQLHTEHYFIKCRFVGLIALVKLSVAIAKKHGCVKSSPSINSFKQSPLLHHFLFGDAGIDTLCQQSGLTRVEMARQACAELGRFKAVPPTMPVNNAGLSNFGNQP